MRNDVLLVNCPPWGTNTPPLALGFLESYLEEKGIKTNIFDFNIELFNEASDYKYLWDLNRKNYWREEESFKKICNLFSESINSAVSRICRDSARLIGFSVSDPRQAMTMEIIRRIKREDPTKLVIVGGPYFLDANITEEEKELIDLFVTGEGEKVLYEIALKYREKKSIEDIQGTRRFIENKEIYIEPVWKNEPLKDYAYPKYRNFKMGLYSSESISTEWSRGCIGRCTFCQNTVHIENYKTRDAENIFEEIRYNVERHGVKHIRVIDPALNGNIGVLDKVCSLIIDNGIKVTWSGLAIARKEMKSELLRKMKRAGCIRLEYGIESGSDDVLRIMNKPHRSEEAKEVLARTKRAGIITVVYLMVGYPGENKKEFFETLRFIRENIKNIDEVQSVNAPYLQTGTGLFTRPEKYRLLIKKEDPKWDYNWETMDGNTLQIRESRAAVGIELIKKFGIPMHLHTLNETKNLSIEDNKQDEEDFPAYIS